ncbi:MAG: sulfatase-like hydrolase/transferase [Planctomycetota bacterium]|nr:sulfatase-like hydrolase/transferase [Planctomycetota bacterium]MDA1113220.1 sulfatase-like hydrolase/transferase [Planctomycetota bacterium]
MKNRLSNYALLIAGVCSGLSCGGEEVGPPPEHASVQRVQAENCTPIMGRVASADSSWITPWFGQAAWSMDAPKVLGDTRPAIYASTPSRFSVEIGARVDRRVLSTAVRRAKPGSAEDGAIRSELFWQGEREMTSLGFVELAATDDRWMELQVEVPAGAGSLVFSTRLAAPGMAQRSAEEVAWQVPTLAPNASPEQPDVLLLVLDTLRLDALEHMPYLHGLMQEGEVWEQAYVPSNWTLPSMASLLTGQAPSEHGCGRGPFAATATGEVEDRSFRSLKPVPTLAEAMRDAGYATSAVHQNPFMEAWTGLHRGFESYVRTADRVGANRKTALDWWVRQEHRPRFLMLHYMTPHLPNGVVKALDNRSIENFFGVDHTAQERLAFFDFESAERSAVREAYQQAAQQLDAELQLVVEKLRADSPNCHILIYADHGEEHWDAGGFEHGFSFDDSVIRVPLAFLKGTEASPKTITRKVPAHHLGTYLLEQLQIANQLPASALGDSENADREVKSTFPLYRSSLGGRLWSPSDKAWVDLPFHGAGSPGPSASIDAWTAERLAELGYAGNSTTPLVK